MCLIDHIILSSLHVLLTILPCLAIVFGGCTLLSVLLLPKFLLKAYQVVLFSPQLGFNCRILFAALAPIPICIWPALVAAGSVIYALLLPLITSVHCDSAVFGGKKDCSYYGDLFSKRFDSCMKQANNLLVDFYNTCNQSYIESMNDYMIPRADGKVYDIPVLQIIFGVVFFALFLPFSVVLTTMSVVLRIVPGICHQLCKLWAGQENTSRGTLWPSCTPCLNELTRMCFLVFVVLALLQFVFIPFAPLVGIGIAITTASRMFSTGSIFSGCHNVLPYWFADIIEFDESVHCYFWGTNWSIYKSCACDMPTQQYSSPQQAQTYAQTPPNPAEAAVDRETIDLITRINARNARNRGGDNYNNNNSNNLIQLADVLVQPSAPAYPVDPQTAPRTVVVAVAATPASIASGGGGRPTATAVPVVAQANARRRYDIAQCWDSFFDASTEVAVHGLMKGHILEKDVMELKSFLFASIPATVIFRALERSQGLNVAGIVLKDNIIITLDNMPMDQFSLQIFQGLITLKNQMHAMHVTKAETAYLDHWLLCGVTKSDLDLLILKGAGTLVGRLVGGAIGDKIANSNEFAEEEGRIGAARVKELKLYGAEIVRLAQLVSRVPTFNRRFGESMQVALVNFNQSKQGGGGGASIGAMIAGAVLSSLFDF